MSGEVADFFAGSRVEIVLVEIEILEVVETVEGSNVERSE